MNNVYGKYRAYVVDNADPCNMGRVTVSCPAIFGDSVSTWCQVCVPFAGYDTNSGMWFIPAKNDLVWLEFEGGDTRYPIVTGGWFKQNGSPVSAYSDYNTQLNRYRIKTPKGHVIELSDVDGEEVIKLWASDNTLVEVGSGGVTITGNLTVSGTVKGSNI